MTLAIFGGTKGQVEKVAAAAHRLGSAIALQTEWIVLTGGSEPANDGTVKNSALKGADDGRGIWMGVPQAKETGPWDTTSHQGVGMVVSTELDDRRNYVEALLCDVAVAFPGGDGTASEVVATLCLGKGVVFLGDWTTSPLWSGLQQIQGSDQALESKTRDAWICDADKRLSPGGQRNAPPKTPTDRLIRRHVIAANLVDAHRRCAFSSLDDPSGTIECVAELLRRA